VIFLFASRSLSRERFPTFTFGPSRVGSISNKSLMYFGPSSFFFRFWGFSHFSPFQSVFSWETLEVDFISGPFLFTPPDPEVSFLSDGDLTFLPPSSPGVTGRTHFSLFRSFVFSFIRQTCSLSSEVVPEGDRRVTCFFHVTCRPLPPFPS